MVATSSTMIPIGFDAPDFSLEDTLSGKTFNFTDKKSSKAYLLCFICNHCPYVIHIMEHLTQQCNQWTQKDISVTMISANDPVKYPADSPAKMKELATSQGFSFPYLFDADQNVAKSYKAACTPDFFLFDRSKKLFYRGQYDGARPGKSDPINGSDLKNAMSLLLSGKSPPEKQIPSLGCNIKWKENNEPDYFGAR